MKVNVWDATGYDFVYVGRNYGDCIAVHRPFFGGVKRWEKLIRAEIRRREEKQQMLDRFSSQTAPAAGTEGKP